MYITQLDGFVHEAVGDKIAALFSCGGSSRAWAFLVEAHPHLHGQREGKRTSSDILLGISDSVHCTLHMFEPCSINRETAIQTDIEQGFVHTVLYINCSTTCIYVVHCSTLYVCMYMCIWTYLQDQIWNPG